MNDTRDHGPQHEEQPSPMDLALRLHRLLRGRYALVITLALLGGGAAAAAGWLLPVPKYTSVGIIEISPKREAIIGESDLTQVTPFFREYVNAEASKIMQDRVLDRAMRSDDWRALKRATSLAGQRAFREAMSVRVQGANHRLIDVAFTDKDPDVARVGAGAVVNAYMEIRAEEDARDRDKVESVRTHRGDLLMRISGLEESIRTVRAPFPGSALEAQRDLRGDVLFEMQSRLAMINAQIAQAQAGDPMEPALEFQSDERLASIDTEMRRLLNDLATEESRLAEARATLGERHHQIGQFTRRVEGLKQRVAQKRDELLKSPLLLTLPRDTAIGFGSLEGLMDARAEIAQQIQEQEDALDALYDAIEREAELRHSIRIARDQLGTAENRLQLFELQGLSGEGGRDQGLVRAAPASRPLRASIDNRKKYAVLGALGGGGFPIGLVLLLGLLDRRFRYSDEAIIGPTTPLLGILPRLPRRLRDPEQASVAAHCVHQIRTLLQIGGADRNTLVITSPTAGDGKTSLVLSLGLSYASAGKRTIVIDLDLVGCGLSSLLDLEPVHGTLSAIESGTLNGHVVSTWAPNLSVLPAATGDVHGISWLTPERIRHLLDAARRQFDMVIIDTGPVLGSLEASLVVTEADAVLLALRRGQRREMAQRAIEYIHSLNGRLVGMVFNQAQPGDFRRAVSSASLRSRPIEGAVHLNGHAERAARLGPMPGAIIATTARDEPA
jgi:succinoglycan biosynthesis transport protein ExoP